MKPLYFPFIFLICVSSVVTAQNSENEIVSNLESIIDLEDEKELQQTFHRHWELIKKDSSLLNQLKLGILYHDMAQKKLTASQSERSYYTHEAYNILAKLKNNRYVSQELAPFVNSYYASSLALLGAEVNKPDMIRQSFFFLDQAVEEYGEQCYVALYLRAKLSYFLPKSFATKAQAKDDFSRIIDRYGVDRTYANAKSMSYVYWAWAELHAARKHRLQANNYLKKAIELDPHDQAAGPKARVLLEHYNQPFTEFSSSVY